MTEFIAITICIVSFSLGLFVGSATQIDSRKNAPIFEKSLRFKEVINNDKCAYDTKYGELLCPISNNLVRND